MNIFFFFLILVFLPGSVFGDPKVLDTTHYQSEVDSDLTIRNISFLPSYDNIRGLYAKSVDEHLKKKIEANHHWEYVPISLVKSHISPEELVGHPKRVKSIASQFNADAFFTAETRKDPKGLNVMLYLFSTRSGRLVAEERMKTKDYGTKTLLGTIDRMVESIRKKIPYDGVILSRRDNRVTVNLGKKDGVSIGQSLPVLKIVGVERHPKRDFIIKTHKVLIGQIRVVKVDPYISFADVTEEKEPGVVAKTDKVSGVSSVKYKPTTWTQDYTPPEVLLSENNTALYGAKPKEWVPTQSPTFGKVGARVSLGTFNNNLSLMNGTNYGTEVDVYPKINLDAELWFSPHWYANATFGQGVSASENPVAGGSPGILSQSLTQYRLSFGYNFLLKNHFFGPKFSLNFGVSSYRMFIDNTQPTSFTSLEYTSFPFGISGYVPISRSRRWGLGGEVFFHLFPHLRESPVSSGRPENTINQIIFYGLYKYSERIRFKLGVEALILATKFEGVGSRSDSPGQNLSQRHMLFVTGAEYMF